MKKSFGIVTILLTLIILVSGCKSQTKAQSKPYDSKVSSVNKTAKKIKDENNITKKVSSLKDLEDEYQKYQNNKKHYKQVDSAYRHNIKTIKHSIQDKNKSTIKSDTTAGSKTETQKTLEKKISSLNDLKKEITPERDVVYTASDFESVNNDIDKQINNNKSQITSYILSTDSPQKYIDAYKQFSMKGNPKGAARGGSDIRSMGFYEAIGLNKTDYFAMFTGTFDYYGNAVEQGWITQAQSDKAFKEAQDKILAGKYATHPVNIHNMNFYQIGIGNYSGLVGSWKEIAEGTNFNRGDGPQDTTPSGQKLTITKDSISDGQVMMSRKSGDGTYFTIQDDSGQVTFDEEDALTLTAEVGAQNYMIVFYPKGVPMQDQTGDDPSKERIFIRTSNNDFSELFARD
ncbi:hypothetical protein [Companilactobacillus kedongensis]|uniref:hypothetical protein n=1 Tax=Companilactobacillus kedongensis TaxID=2486004 RepID=UPI000F7A6D23|nr:hypothetical protein [Companilactobacillus kedongensis]